MLASEREGFFTVAGLAGGVLKTVWAADERAMNADQALQKKGFGAHLRMGSFAGMGWLAYANLDV